MGDNFISHPVIEHPVIDTWIHLTTGSIASNSTEVNEIVSTIWRLILLTTRNQTDQADDIINDLSFPNIILASLNGGNESIRKSCLETTFQFSTNELLRTRIIGNFSRTGFGLKIS